MFAGKGKHTWNADSGGNSLAALWLSGNWSGRGLIRAAAAAGRDLLLFCPHRLGGNEDDPLRSDHGRFTGFQDSGGRRDNTCMDIFWWLTAGSCLPVNPGHLRQNIFIKQCYFSASVPDPHSKEPTGIGSARRTRIRIHSGDKKAEIKQVPVTVCTLNTYCGLSLILEICY